MTAMRAVRPLALTMGDPAGIGIELSIEAWLRRGGGSGGEPLPAFVVYGSAEAILARARDMGRTIDVARVGAAADGVAVFAAALPVIDLPLDVPARAGAPDAANGAVVIAAIERAVADVVAGAASAVVTNPIAKAVLYRAGFAHPGHTEFLAALAKSQLPDEPADAVMMIASEALRVVPLTIHIPLADVPRAITREAIVKTVRIMAGALQRDFAIARPRIAVAGLNPHAGEDGNMGAEDRDVIAPAIAELVAEGFAVSGPHPADTLFHAAARVRYDAVLGMYHDQVLIPAKTLAFDTGVNVTLGLPFVRTSPDHGTAFDIAGRGTASPESLIAALRLAHEMSEQRAAAADTAPPSDIAQLR